MFGTDLQHYWVFEEDFFGGGTLSTAGQYDPWVATLTGTTPTCARVDLGESTVAGAIGSVSIALSATDEVQNACLSFGDVLAFDMDKLRGFEARIKLGQSALVSASSVAFGITGDRNDAIDSIAVAAIFRVVGADDTTAVVLENDDGTNTNDDISSGKTLLNAWKTFRIEFPEGNASCTYWIDNVQVGTGTTFAMSAHHGGVQPFFQIQKTGGTTAHSIQIDYVKIWGVR